MGKNKAYFSLCMFVVLKVLCVYHIFSVFERQVALLFNKSNCIATMFESVNKFRKNNLIDLFPKFKYATERTQ